MFIANRWKDYELLYAGEGEKFERWGSTFLARPDPQAIWPKTGYADMEEAEWPIPHARYYRSETGGGHWEKERPMKPKWTISYDFSGHPLTFIIEPTSFKHTGLFPEQAANWDFCGDLIAKRAKAGKAPRVLNLFAYTGGATLACAAAGASEVVHVDASKGMIARAKENVTASHLEDAYIRFIAEDCSRFVEREIRRGRTYDAIIMDPPSYGRGPSGELWKLEEALFPLVEKCAQLLSDNPLFFLVNSYTTGLSGLVVEDILRLTVCKRHGGSVDAQELGIPATKMDLVLPCGSTARWTNTEAK
ncbi:MAG TPA: class I SAM-dependent methyltransferase [Bacillota bacterium]|nr:class I SAM-dependent methyltransferase [Bacillota bacterium]HPE39127.1 class I SAM-dependent methyltransferase [Bacillota bacterium]